MRLIPFIHASVALAFLASCASVPKTGPGSERAVFDRKMTCKRSNLQTAYMAAFLKKNSV